MRIAKETRVRLKVRLSEVGGGLIEDGEVEYVHGAGTMLAGLEAAVAGLETGAKKSGVIPAAQAFGDPSKQPTKKIKRGEFPKELALAAGARLTAKSDAGQPVVLEVIEIAGDEVTVRLVHPLAAKDIAFDVEVRSVHDRLPPPLPSDAIVDAE